MKKSIVAVIVIALLFVASTAFADSAFKKLYRGVVNFVTSPLEIGVGIRDSYEESGILKEESSKLLKNFFKNKRK